MKTDNVINANNLLLIIMSGMMEITWLYAIAGIFFLLLNAPLFPIWAALIGFFLPIIIVSLLKGRGRRIIEHFFIHSFFYLLVLLYTIYNYGYGKEAFFGFKWLEMFFQKQFGTIDGFAYILLIFSYTLFWYNGYRLINRSNDHMTVSSRFDLGIVMLVVAFIISGSTNTVFPDSNLLISYYFLFSMLAIILSQNSKSTKIGLADNNNKSDLIFTSIPVIFLLVSWVLLFFLPQMTSVAQASYQVIKVVSNPIGKILLKILTFLFGSHRISSDVSSGDSAGSGIPIPDENQLSWLGKILQWIVTWLGILLFSALAILAVGYLFYSLWKWFSLKTELNIERKGFLEELLLWAKHVFLEIKIFLNKYWVLLQSYVRKKDNTYTIFHKLCKWGSHSGVPRQIYQTPLEYGTYLISFFPDMDHDIELIVDNFNKNIYGKKSDGEEELKEIKKAWRRLSSPSKWPLRLLTKYFYSKKINLEQIPTHS